MRPLVLALTTAVLVAAVVPARDGDGPRPSGPRTTDPDRRPRLHEYLAAFHRLSPAMQGRVRKLDRDLHDEDVVTRVRLFGVMERYASWLARLAEADRLRIEAAPAGAERLRVVRDLLEQQWLNGVPAEYAGKPESVERWRREERERQQARAQSLRLAEELALLPAVQQQRFRADVQKFVKDRLEPALDPKERKRLESVSSKGTWYAYFHTVLVLSEAHNLRPPGPIDLWERFRDPRPRPNRPE
jgi:hypothetical protein